MNCILEWATSEMNRQNEREKAAENIVFGDGMEIDRCPCNCKAPGIVCDDERARRIRLREAHAQGLPF